MGRHAPRLMVASADGFPKKFEIPDDVWSLLPVPKKQGNFNHHRSREGFAKICRKHIDEMTYELDAFPMQAAYKIISGLRRKSAPFIQFTTDFLDGADNDTKAVKFALLQSLKEFPAELHLGTTQTGDRKTVFLTEFNLRRIGWSLDRMLARIEHDLRSEEGQGYVLGVAFPAWLREMKRYGASRRLATTAFRDNGDPTAFSVFLYRVHLLFPDEARPKKEVSPDPVTGEKPKPRRIDVLNPKAMAQQLERASFSPSN